MWRWTEDSHTSNVCGLVHHWKWWAARFMQRNSRMPGCADKVMQVAGGRTGWNREMGQMQGGSGPGREQVCQQLWLTLGQRNKSSLILKKLQHAQTLPWDTADATLALLHHHTGVIVATRQLFFQTGTEGSFLLYGRSILAADWRSCLCLFLFILCKYPSNNNSYFRRSLMKLVTETTDISLFSPAKIFNYRAFPLYLDNVVIDCKANNFPFTLDKILLEVLDT